MNNIQTSFGPTKSARYRNRGITLIELMLVVIIGGILATVAAGSYSRYIQQARNSRAIADLAELKLLIDKYRLNNNDGLPLTLNEAGAGGRTDPWGNAYAYLNFATVKGVGKMRKDRNLVPINSEFDLYSKGPDGQSVAPLTAKSSQDDIIVANNGGFIGKASEY